MAEIGSNVRNIAIRVRVLLSFIDRMQVELSQVNTAVVGTRGVPLPVHNIIMAVEQMIPDLQKKWTRFGDNRRVYAINIKLFSTNLALQIINYFTQTPTAPLNPNLIIHNKYLLNTIYVTRYEKTDHIAKNKKIDFLS